MPISNPLVQITRLVTTGLSDQYFLYVTTHFGRSDYTPNGYDSISSPEDGVLTVVVKVAKEGTALRLNKSVSHQVPLTSVDMDEVEEIHVVVKESTTTLGSTIIVHQDETETVVKPLST